MRSILTYAPEGKTLRPVQIKVLLEVEENWHKYDVFVAPVAVGGGKSLIAMTIREWQKDRKMRVSIITPQVMLQDQYAVEYPKVPSLKGKARYSCDDGYETCEDRYDTCESHCAECPYTEAKRGIAENGGGVFNFHSYLYGCVGTDVLIVDEAHTIFDVLSEYYTKFLYKIADKYDNINTIGDALAFMEKQTLSIKRELATLAKGDMKENGAKIRKLKRTLENLKTVSKGVQNYPKEFFFERIDDTYRGKTTEAIRIQPLDLSNLAAVLWPYGGKIVLMSGTINTLDIQKLGLNMKRVKMIDCPNAIDPERRPVWYTPVANMSYKYQATSVPIMARHLKQLIADHPNDKGVIHAPYQLAVKLQSHLYDDRIIWHTKETKEAAYQEFRSSTRPCVLVASGMSEGIDLPYDAGRWQAIIKIQYPSLADNLMQYFINKEPGWYKWMTIRTVVQQCGRICRGPTDYGETFILDSSFDTLYKMNRSLFPQYFIDALKRSLPKRGSNDNRKV
jgi:Rad3-related DNA helicase